MKKKIDNKPKISPQILSLINPKNITEDKFDNQIKLFEEKLNSTEFDPINYRQIKALQVIYLKTLSALSKSTALTDHNIDHHVFAYFLNENDANVL
jgi:hypothetical protein